ncbi:MAG TPA: metal ABC transporter ATP-binding protein [Candidatus Aquilonibacter sp.]|nr:metal ABC transporter ATP-binding protein [Candidatus Aquilonibacter sp.]
MKKVLSVAKLGVSFGERIVIRDLSFNVNEGDCVAVIGPNGAGKTALLRALMGLVPYQGTIQWASGARLGYVPQQIAADRQLPLSAMDLLAAKMGRLKLERNDFEGVASEVGLTQDILNTSVGTLSGGQFQKVLVAFALLGKPNALLFDEPTASLDELAEEHIYELLQKLQKEKGMTTLLVSHDLSVVYRNANVVLCLGSRRPCMGTPREVLTPETLAEIYGAPAHYYQHAHGHAGGESFRREQP